MRWIPISLILTLVPAILGWAAWDWRGAAIAALIVWAFWIYALAKSESIVAQALDAKVWRPSGKKRRNRERARVLVYPEPAPAALIVRSAFGRGIVIVSQGMVGCLSDDEFAALIRTAKTRLRTRGIVVASLSAVLLLWVSRFSPQGWLGVLLQDRPVVKGEGQSLTPLSAVHFVMLFPLTRLLLGERRKAQEPGLPRDAVRKIEKMRRIWPAAGGRLPAALERSSALSILG
jgi:hypothetical protein